jgi:hypothetical protein
MPREVFVNQTTLSQRELEVAAHRSKCNREQDKSPGDRNIKLEGVKD